MINPQWLELPMSRTNFHGPKGVRATESRLYIHVIKVTEITACKRIQYSNNQSITKDILSKIESRKATKAVKVLCLGSNLDHVGNQCFHFIMQFMITFLRCDKDNVKLTCADLN